METALLLPPPDVAVLEISGGDRIDFLQQVVSNDLVGLAPGEARMALLLTPKGKLEAPLTVHALEDHLLVTCPAELREAVARKLGMYVMRRDASVEDATDRTAVVRVAGAGAEAAVEGAGAGGAAFSTDEAGPPGFDLFVPAEDADALRERLRAAGAEDADAGRAEALRVAAGEPRWGSEMDGSVLPPEIPVLVTRAISYDKGCYVGQETIARIKTYGHVNRELRRLEIGGDDLPDPGAVLHDGEKEVGKVTSAARHPDTDKPIALAFVKRGHFDPGTELAVEAAGAEVVARVL